VSGPPFLSPLSPDSPEGLILRLQKGLKDRQTDETRTREYRIEELKEKKQTEEQKINKKESSLKSEKGRKNFLPPHPEVREKPWERGWKDA